MSRVNFMRIASDAPDWPSKLGQGIPFASALDVPGRALGVVTEAAHVVMRQEYIRGRIETFHEHVPERHWIAYVEEEGPSAERVVMQAVAVRLRALASSETVSIPESNLLIRIVEELTK